MLISGGDPLTLSDERLDYLLGRLRAIKHVEFVRLGTKVPVVLPMRVTRALIRVLKKHHPLWMSLHFTHPDRAHARGRPRPARGWPMPAFRSAARRCCSRASTTRSRR